MNFNALCNISTMDKLSNESIVKIFKTMFHNGKILDLPLEDQIVLNLAAAKAADEIRAKKTEESQKVEELERRVREAQMISGGSVFR
jgi:hypothetical protein